MMVNGYAPFVDSLAAALPAHSGSCEVSWHLDQNARYAVRGIAGDMPRTKLCRTDLEHQLVVAL
jgi:hypothetical protein